MKNQKANSDNSPRKTEESHRVVTITLPENILSMLEALDRDLSQAIINVTHLARQRGLPKGSAYEIVKVAPRKSVFIVGSDTQISKIPWIKLVEIAPGRNLIAIPSGTSLESVEIAILGIIENIPSDNVKERVLLEEFCKYVGRLRRNKKISQVEIMVVDTDD